MVILYGIFSSVSYSANVYLALRVVYPRATWLGFVVRLSLWTYVIVCACNWTTPTPVGVASHCERRVVRHQHPLPGSHFYAS